MTRLFVLFKQESSSIKISKNNNNDKNNWMINSSSYINLGYIVNIVVGNRKVAKKLYVWK